MSVLAVKLIGIGLLIATVAGLIKILSLQERSLKTISHGLYARRRIRAGRQETIEVGPKFITWVWWYGGERYEEAYTYVFTNRILVLFCGGKVEAYDCLARKRALIIGNVKIFRMRGKKN